MFAFADANKKLKNVLSEFTGETNFGQHKQDEV